MKYEILKEKIVYFTDAIPNHKEILEALENTENELITKWIPWGNIYASSVEQAKSSDRYDYGESKCVYTTEYDLNQNFKDTYWIFNSINNAILEASDIYKKIMSIPDNNPRLNSGGYVIGRYNSGSEKGLHIDCPYDDLEHSYVIYYNDNYNGGELHFPELDLIFKPKAGSIVMFKSSDKDTIHQARKADGHKYISPHFWRMGPSLGFIPWNHDIEKYFSTLSSGPIASEVDTLDRYI